MGAAVAPIIAGGLSAVGGFLGGNAQAKANKVQTKEQAREFNLGNWVNAAHGAETSGLRDKLLAIFGQIASQGPQTFRPRDAFNPTGIDQAGNPTGPSQGNTSGAMNPAQLSLPSTYKMGDGGVNPDVYTWLLRNLGYRPTDDPSRMAAAAKLAQEKQQYQQGQNPGNLPFVGFGNKQQPVPGQRLPFVGFGNGQAQGIQGIVPGPIPLGNSRNRAGALGF